MTRDQLIEKNFNQLHAFARELAESWINGNKSDVIETLEGQGRGKKLPLVLLVAQALDEEPAKLARVLYVRSHS